MKLAKGKIALGALGSLALLAALTVATGSNPTPANSEARKVNEYEGQHRLVAKVNEYEGQHRLVVAAHKKINEYEGQF